MPAEDPAAPTAPNEISTTQTPVSSSQSIQQQAPSPRPRPSPSAGHASSPTDIQLPAWLSTASGHLLFITDLDTWHDMINKWLVHECELEYPDGSKANWLPTEKRPEEITYWLARGRVYEKPPPLKDTKLFGETWKSWWRALQPEWRQFGWPPAQESTSTSTDWGVVHQGGCNTLFLVLLSLSWWLVAASEEGSDMGNVHTAVRDVSWVLKEMHKSDARKRPADTPEDATRKRHKKSS